MSQLFAVIFEQLATDYENADKQDDMEMDTDRDTVRFKPNYAAIYRHLAEGLGGKYPPELSADDSFIVLSLIENLKETLAEEKTFKNAKQFIKRPDFLQRLGKEYLEESLTIIKPLKCKSTIETLEVQDTELICGGPAPDADFNDTESNPIVEPISSSSNSVPPPNPIDELVAYLEECLNFPKIKKIKWCLNPLDVPADLLDAQRNKLMAIMRKYV